MTIGIDWGQAPNGAKWWAMDFDGKAFWYMTPNLNPQTNFWYMAQIEAPTFDYSEDWRKSLIERPIM
ncbi:hypothetical protein BCF11_5164 [Collimonas sp. PA-H2]|uniref:hypothetical protein n=1 Tax=Collimonas sp. PA-H2 TaxID=1881062 RepID=UPI000C010F57|nr:hypothetical protein [Collimonas sp. PA-H2]PFH04389.1 hypothetical protein BCF11_5164 [Collimonas sp. PA-H2]